MDETQVLQEYEPMLNKIVNSFMSRASAGSTSRKEDLMQEARISFLKHIRTHQPSEYGKCYFTILHDLCEAVRRDYPFGISRHDFLSSNRQALFIYGLDDVWMLEDKEEPLSGCDLLCELQAVLETHSQQDSEIIRLKTKGITSRQIAQRLCISETYVSRTLKKIRMEMARDEQFI